MVALNRFLLTIFAAGVSCISAAGQQIQPRIDGLETNSTYMNLLAEDNRLTMREDSIAVVVESLREVYRTNAADASSSREQIISLENQLFELRSRKAMVIDSLNLIEQEWVVNNMGRVEVAPTEESVLLEANSDAKFIYEDPNVKANLSDVDYRNLIKAEELEQATMDLSNRYIVNYDHLLSLASSYTATPLQSDAIEVKRDFDSLYMVNQEILDQLGNSWGFIYDNKSFAYSMLMELLGFSDVLQQEAELMRNAQAEISAKQQVNGSDELLRYLVQKSSMVKFESLVADRLGLVNITDSLKIVSRGLSEVEKVSYPQPRVEERLFILYEPIEIVTRPLYTASNPIPETVFYEKGTIFRLYVGSFAAKQTVATFRNTTPLSHCVNDLNRHCYYIGGFETYEQAQEGYAVLKKQGFRAPQIVVWVDGRERNLTTDPLPLTSSYRLEVLDIKALPEGASDRVAEIAPSSTITKVGTDKFVIMSLERQSQADSLAAELRQIDPQLNVIVEKSEAKIEF
ncbi:MAG: hypothetical protein R3Y44_00460 [Rikenellaceae bacterium]